MATRDCRPGRAHDLLRHGNPLATGAIDRNSRCRRARGRRSCRLPTDQSAVPTSGDDPECEPHERSPIEPAPAGSASRTGAEVRTVLGGAYRRPPLSADRIQPVATPWTSPSQWPRSMGPTTPARVRRHSCLPPTERSAISSPLGAHSPPAFPRRSRRTPAAILLPPRHAPRFPEEHLEQVTVLPSASSITSQDVPTRSSAAAGPHQDVPT
jgi:hypothetical protein